MENHWLAELKKISISRDDSGLPIYHRMIECMSQMIADGRIRDAMHLPPDTQVAAELGISHITCNFGRYFSYGIRFIGSINISSPYHSNAVVISVGIIGRSRNRCERAHFTVKI